MESKSEPIARRRCKTEQTDAREKTGSVGAAVYSSGLVENDTLTTSPELRYGFVNTI